MQPVTLISILSPAIVMHAQPAPPMDVLAVFGFFTAFLTLVIGLHRSRGATLAMAVCLAALSVYGLMSGAWPVALVLLALSAARVEKWRRWPAGRRTWNFYSESGAQNQWSGESRLTRLFGSN